MSVASLIRDIIQNNPPLAYLNLNCFSSYDSDGNVSAGEIILEALLNSSICTIQHLDLSNNSSWFRNDSTGEERKGVDDMLVEVINKQTPSLQILNLNFNYFSSVTTEKLLTRIAEFGV